MRAALQKVVDDFNLDINDPFTRIIAAAFAFQDERDAANARLAELQRPATGEEVTELIKALAGHGFMDGVDVVQRLDRALRECCDHSNAVDEECHGLRLRAEAAEAALAAIPKATGEML